MSIDRGKVDDGADKSHPALFHVCLAGLDLLFRFVSISEYWGCELTASPRTSQTYKGVSYLLSHLSARRRNISYV